MPWIFPGLVEEEKEKKKNVRRECNDDIPTLQVISVGRENEQSEQRRRVTVSAGRRNITTIFATAMQSTESNPCMH